MELIRYIAPFDASGALSQLEKIFGVEERLLEECQLNGSEAGYNKDIVYLAYENGTLLGMIHGTIPLKTPNLAGLSGMFTTEAARGKGIGKLLFSKIVEEVSMHGVRLAVLGTGNPVAAKLYAQFGFGFCPGSNVMARFSQGGMVDFVRDSYRELHGNAQISRGTPAMRIPVIPLVLQQEFGLILDINTAIFNTSAVTQRSCMGLFPRYEALRKQGGDYFMAFDEAGVLGAVCSVCPRESGSCRADFFALPAFEPVVPSMIHQLEANFGSLYFEIAHSDTGKAHILQENGWTATADGCCAAGDLMIKTVIYSR